MPYINERKLLTIQYGLWLNDDFYSSKYFPHFEFGLADSIEDYIKKCKYLQYRMELDDYIDKDMKFFKDFYKRCNKFCKLYFDNNSTPNIYKVFTSNTYYQINDYKYNEINFNIIMNIMNTLKKIIEMDDNPEFQYKSKWCITIGEQQ